MKAPRLRVSARPEFRAGFFNALHRHNSSKPIPTITSPNFREITNAPDLPIAAFCCEARLLEEAKTNVKTKTSGATEHGDASPLRTGSRAGARARRNAAVLSAGHRSRTTRIEKGTGIRNPHPGAV